MAGVNTKPAEKPDACHGCGFPSQDLVLFAQQRGSYKGKLDFWFCELCAETHASVMARFTAEYQMADRRIMEGLCYVGNVILKRIAQASQAPQLLKELPPWELEFVKNSTVEPVPVAPTARVIDPRAVDYYAVHRMLDHRAQSRTSPESVLDVLSALIRMADDGFAAPRHNKDCICEHCVKFCPKCEMPRRTGCEYVACPLPAKGSG